MSTTEVPPIVAEAQALAGEVDAYADGHYPAPHRMGQFDTLQVGSFVVVPEDQLTTQTYFGLRHTDTFLDVLLTTESGDFSLISNSVRNAADGTLSATPWLGAYKSSPNGLVPDPRYQPWTGGITQTLRGDTVTYALSDPAEEFSFDATTFEWKVASGDARVSGTLAGNGTQWRLPWRQPNGETSEMLYLQQGYRVAGTYFGEPVTGHVVLETMWGNEDYVETWWVQNRIGHWAFFVNNYADGTSEFGQILCGEYGARGVVITDDQAREVIGTPFLNAYEEEGGRVRYDFGNGNEWEFVAAPERGMPPFGTTTLAIGAVRRIGEQREITEANAVYLTAERMPPTVSLDGR